MYLSSIFAHSVLVCSVSLSLFLVLAQTTPRRTKPQRLPQSRGRSRAPSNFRRFWLFETKQESLKALRGCEANDGLVLMRPQEVTRIGRDFIPPTTHSILRSAAMMRFVHYLLILRGHRLRHRPWEILAATKSVNQNRRTDARL